MSTAAQPALAADLTPQQQIVLLNEAQRAFDRGSELRQSNPTAAAAAYREATDKFQVLVDSGIRNGKLYYNLANAQVQIDDIGKTILNYRRAQRLIPSDGRLEANLRFARSLRRNQIPTSAQRAVVKTLFFWHFRYPLRTRFYLGLVAYVIFWGLLLGRLLWLRAGWGYAIVPCLLLWVTLGMSAATEVFYQSRHAEGVLVTDDVIVRKGNGEGFDPQFEETLHEGVEFTVLETRRGWLRIELPDGHTGWVRANQAELI